MLPVTEGLLVAMLGTHLVLLVFVVWCLRRAALRIRRALRLVIGKMDCDELIDKLLSAADPQGADAGPAEGAPPAAAPAAMPDTSQDEERVQKRRERLAATAAGGQAGQYGLVVRGKTFTADQIDALDNTEIEKLYARYEARLGAAMTKTWDLRRSSSMRGWLPCSSQSKTSQGLSQTSRATRLSDTRLAVLPASSTTATACSLHRCADHLEALPIWTLLPCWSIRWRRRSRRIKRRRRSQYRILQWKELQRKLRIHGKW